MPLPARTFCDEDDYECLDTKIVCEACEQCVECSTLWRRRVAHAVFESGGSLSKVISTLVLMRVCLVCLLDNFKAVKKKRRAEVEIMPSFESLADHVSSEDLVLLDVDDTILSPRFGSVFVYASEGWAHLLRALRVAKHVMFVTARRDDDPDVAWDRLRQQLFQIGIIATQDHVLFTQGSTIKGPNLALALVARGLAKTPAWFIDDNYEACLSVMHCLPHIRTFSIPLAFADVTADVHGHVVLSPLPPSEM